jgi:hypothetical protein
MARDNSKPTEVRIFAPPHCKYVEIAYTVNITLSTMKLTDPIKFQTVRLTLIDTKPQPKGDSRPFRKPELQNRHNERFT